MEMEEVDVLSEKIHDQVYVHTYTNGSNDKKLDGLSRLLDAEEQARGILQAAHEEVKIMRSRMKQEVDESIKKGLYAEFSASILVYFFIYLV